MPMAIRMSPPTASTLFPHRVPIRRPSSIPAPVKAAVNTPMTRAGTRMGMPISARESPTASASILVATDRMTRFHPRVGSRRSSFSPERWNAPRNIIPPTKASSPKATQWSKAAMKR